MDFRTASATNTAPATWQTATSLEAADDFTASFAIRPRYCPTELLAGFALLMAGHGRCVNTSMMIGDREYAMWQLGCARAVNDAELSALAQRLFPYFDDAKRSSPPVPATV